MGITATTVTAAVVSSSNRPPPLHLDDPELSDSSPYRQNIPRRASNSSSNSESDDSPQSPGLSALDSSAALILVHDDAEDMDVDYGFEDDEEFDDEDDIVSPVFEIRRTSIPPLSPPSIFMYLLAPFLKLGALNITRSSGSLPLKFGLPWLLAAAIMSAFSRQLWYMLARYLRKAEVTEVLCDTFAKARGKERQRRIIRSAVKIGTALISSLIALVYLHESVNAVLPHLPSSTLARYAIGLGFGLSVFYLSTSKSLASRRVVVASWLSILSYIAWLGCAIYAHSNGILVSSEGSWLGSQPSLWQGIFTIAFTFCTSSTLPLYASLKSGSNTGVSTAKTPRSRSFRLLSFASIICATLLVLPLVIFAAFPNVPAPVTPPNKTPQELTSLPPLLSRAPTPQTIQIALSVLTSITLLLGVPQAILTIPALPIPFRLGRTANFNVARMLLAVILVSTSLILSFLGASFIFAPLTIILVSSAFASTYFLPALLHICVHLFKRPLAIVMPRTPLVNTHSSSSSSSDLDALPHTTMTRAVHDELLQRKERALQKKQFRKRIVWDIGAWVQLGVCALGVVIGVLLLR